MHPLGTTLFCLLWAVGALVARAANSHLPRIEFIDARTGAPCSLPAAGELEARLAPLLGEWESAPGIERIVDAVIAHAADHGWPVIEVEAATPVSHAAADRDFAPVLQLRIWPGLIRSVSLEGGSRWMRSAIADDWARRAGAPLDLTAIDAWLDWTHRNPFHQVTLSFDPGPEPATADGLLSLHSETLTRAFVAWRDDGVEPLGPQRFTTGFEIGDPAGLPVWASAEFVAGEDWPDYRSVRGQMRAFLPWHHEWRLSASWTTADLDGFLPGLPITSSLRSFDVSTRYVVPLGKWGGWRADGGVGFDFRRTESGVSLAGQEDRGTADTAQVVGEASFRRLTASSQVGAVVSGFWSPGEVTAYNASEEVAVLRPGAEADYVGVRGEAVGRWELPRQWAVVARGAAQWTSDPPLPTVQLAVSGAQAVRGFDEAVVLADVGVWGGLEFHAPGWSRAVGSRHHTLVPVVFADAGWARNLAVDEDTTIASAGVGVRVRSGRPLSFSFDYGWRLTDPGGRAHFALVLSF